MGSGKDDAETSGLCYVLAVILLAMGIAKIAIGVKYVHDCELQPMIPIFLIVGGFTSVLLGVLRFVAGGCKEKNYASGAFIIGIIVVVFSLAWLVAGFSFVFPNGERLHVPQCNPGYNDCKTCDSVLFDFATAIIIVEVVCLALILGCICYMKKNKN